MPPIKHLISSLLNKKKISSLSFLSGKNRLHKTVALYRFVKVRKSTIGRYTYVANNTYVECADIGQFCSIADNCRIGMGSHSISLLSTSPIFSEARNGVKEQWIETDLPTTKRKRTVIGNDVWIGSHVLINSNVNVGDGAVIGAGAVVVKDVPPYAIVGGVPAKVIRYRFSEDVINELMQLKWWDMSEDILKKNIIFFQKDNIEVEDVRAFRGSL